MILADKIMTLRKKNGWSQEELANRLSVSRQSVSKWESAQSVPELEKILMMSQLFGVTTDYLLKDDMEEEEYAETVEDEVSARRKVTVEQANEFMKLKQQTAKMIALGVFLCITSPIILILLGGMSDVGMVAENAAAALGIILLLLFVAAGVVLFVLSGFKTSAYEYLEQESIETEYGVQGLVKERQKRDRNTYIRSNVIGVAMCILAAVPLFACILIDEENELLMAAMVGVLLLLVATGVFFFISGGVVWEGYQMLLQEGDYTEEKKKNARRSEKAKRIYWILVTAIYLAWSFATMDWQRTWIVWPVAGVLSGVIEVICSIVMSPGE